MFEYKVVDIDEVRQKEADFLNYMGKEGWEMVQVNNEPLNKSSAKLVKFYFKRKLTQY